MKKVFAGLAFVAAMIMPACCPNVDEGGNGGAGGFLETCWAGQIQTTEGAVDDWLCGCAQPRAYTSDGVMRCSVCECPTQKCYSVPFVDGDDHPEATGVCGDDLACSQPCVWP